VGIAFAEEQDPYAKFDHLLKDGKITEEYLTELANEMIKDSKESVKSLSGSYKDEESLIRNYGNINKSLLN
jgi:polyhydroxyalkanoate synthesis regulator phasin